MPLILLTYLALLLGSAMMLNVGSVTGYLLAGAIILILYAIVTTLRDVLRNEVPEV